MCIRDSCRCGPFADDRTRAGELILHRQRARRVGVTDIDQPCLLYTSDAADERSSVDLGGRRIIKKKKNKQHAVARNTVDHKHLTEDVKHNKEKRTRKETK